MEDNVLIEHLANAEARLSQLGSAPAVGFGLLCVDRQLQIISRTFFEASWARDLYSRLCRAVYESWASLPECDFSHACTLLPDPLNYMDEGQSNAHAVAYYILNTIVDLLQAIRERRFCYSTYTAARNLDLIEMLADEAALPPETSGQLYRSEMNRQHSDLTQLEFGTSPLDLRCAAKDVDLFAGMWFESSRCNGP